MSFSVCCRLLNDVSLMVLKRGDAVLQKNGCTVEAFSTTTTTTAKKKKKVYVWMLR